jgi:hypothetical protein
MSPLESLPLFLPLGESPSFAEQADKRSEQRYSVMTRTQLHQTVVFYHMHMCCGKSPFRQSFHHLSVAPLPLKSLQRSSGGCEAQ